MYIADVIAPVHFGSSVLGESSTVEHKVEQERLVNTLLWHQTDYFASGLCILGVLSFQLIQGTLGELFLH